MDQYPQNSKFSLFSTCTAQNTLYNQTSIVQFEVQLKTIKLGISLIFFALVRKLVNRNSISRFTANPYLHFFKFRNWFYRIKKKESMSIEN